MSDDSYIPEVGPWAKDKLDCLGKYLNAYTIILRKKNFKGYVYIDAFAGTGRSRVRKERTSDDLSYLLFNEEIDKEQEEFIDGSPKIALGLKHQFTHYVFIEKDEKRLRELENLKTEYPKTDIRIHNRDCNEYLLELLEQDRPWSKWRSVIFLDPFGVSEQIPWTTMEKLASTGSFEVFVHFPMMAINRLSNNDANIRKGHKKILDGFFGSNEWFDIMYKNQPSDLFDDQRARKIDKAQENLVNFYKGKLSSAFGLASSARLFRNTKNSPLYYLIWAGRYDDGQKIANDILSKGEII